MSLEEIKDVLKDNLEKRGVLNKIRANLRAEIFKSFEEQDHNESTDFWLKKQSAKPKPSDVQFLINELLIEYLEYNHMDYTKSVFVKECNQPPERLDKRFLSHELNIRKTYDETDEDGDSIPLLYSIVHRLRNENVREKRRDLSNDQIRQPADSHTYQKPILHVEPNTTRELERIQRGFPESKQRANPTVVNRNKQKIQTIDNNSSAISSEMSSPRRDEDVDFALSKIIQQNSKLSRLQKKNSPPSGSGFERTESKSSRMFNLNNRDNFNYSDDHSSNSDFSMASNEKRMTTGVPHFSVNPYRGDDSNVDDSIELVYKH